MGCHSYSCGKSGGVFNAEIYSVTESDASCEKQEDCPSSDIFCLLSGLYPMSLSLGDSHQKCCAVSCMSLRNLYLYFTLT